VTAHAILLSEADHFRDKMELGIVCFFVLVASRQKADVQLKLVGLKLLPTKYSSDTLQTRYNGNMPIHFAIFCYVYTSTLLVRC
jgi:hypothetical protein